MNIKMIRNIGIGFCGVLGGLYILFLLLPFIASPILNNYIPQINEEIKKSTGLISSIENIKLVATPKLTVGAKVGEFKVSAPDSKEVLNAKNFQVKMSLLPLLAKRIEVDLVTLGEIKADLGIFSRANRTFAG